jgi:hypothetical protein
MIARQDLSKIYETLFSMPGMGEPVKVELKIPRRQLLLLHKAILRGISPKESDEKSIVLLDSAGEEMTRELLTIAEELLKKAGLSEMNARLNGL